MSVSRLFHDSLPATSLGPVSFTSALQPSSAVVDAVTTMWSSNPFGDLSPADTPTTAIVEVTLTRADTGDAVPLTIASGAPRSVFDVANSSANNSESEMPMYFLADIGAGLASRFACALSS